MNLVRVIREPSVDGATLGSLYVNDVWECWTLEDALREPRYDGTVADRAAWVRTWKVPGQTAIPAGLYPLVLEHSPRFRRVLPTVQDVPGFAGVRVHAGNTHEDTEGCLLVGRTRRPPRVLESRLALEALIGRLRGLTGPTMIRYENPPGWHLPASGGGE